MFLSACKRFAYRLTHSFFVFLILLISTHLRAADVEAEPSGAGTQLYGGIEDSVYVDVMRQVTGESIDLSFFAHDGTRYTPQRASVAVGILCRLYSEQVNDVESMAPGLHTLPLMLSAQLKQCRLGLTDQQNSLFMINLAKQILLEIRVFIHSKTVRSDNAFVAGFVGELVQWVTALKLLPHDADDEQLRQLVLYYLATVGRTERGSEEKKPVGGEEKKSDDTSRAAVITDQDLATYASELGVPLNRRFDNGFTLAAMRGYSSADLAPPTVGSVERALCWRTALCGLRKVDFAHLAGAIAEIAPVANLFPLSKYVVTQVGTGVNLVLEKAAERNLVALQGYGEYSRRRSHAEYILRRNDVCADVHFFVNATLAWSFDDFDIALRKIAIGVCCGCAKPYCASEGCLGRRGHGCCGSGTNIPSFAATYRTVWNAA